MHSTALPTEKHGARHDIAAVDALGKSTALHRGGPHESVVAKSR